MKKTRGILLFFMLYIFIFPSQASAAEIRTLYPSKDTYLSVAGSSGYQSINYGLVDEIIVGNTSNVACIGLFEFYVSSLSNSIKDYTFSCDMTVHGNVTCMMKIFLLKGISWIEDHITTSNCPFNAIDLWTAEVGAANCTSIAVDVSQTRLDFPLHFTPRTDITLVFAFSPTDTTWIEIRSRQNLNDEGNMAHLEYVNPWFVDVFVTIMDNLDWVEFIGGITILLGICTITLHSNRYTRRYNKKKTPQSLLEQPPSSKEPERACTHCSELNPLSAKYCNKCGKYF